MKPYAFTAAAVGILLSIGTASAYHPADRNIRGTMEQEQRERIDFEDVQRGVFRGSPSATTAGQPARSARSARRGANTVPPYLTEHHTR